MTKTAYQARYAGRLEPLPSPYPSLVFSEGRGTATSGEEEAIVNELRDGKRVGRTGIYY
ncbi:hypothetical protein BGW80DRAFT_1327336 [Lactifluus volemus]|nr:hypothetical protein BGW80DRAFT_1327336 [Lactifluus volemus]